MRNYRITINGKTHLVAIEDPHDIPVRVEVNGSHFEVYVDWVGTEDEARVTPAVSPDSEVVSNAGTGMEGRETTSPQQAPVPPHTRFRDDEAASSDSLTAPMPGTILSIAVKPGDSVEQGQEVCVLEAMKMKNSIRSPRQGTVSKVAIAEGATVAYGDVLVRFE
jgi:biotin carboxyl carrier protein